MHAVTKPCSRHELSRVASVPPSGYARCSTDRRKEGPGKKAGGGERDEGARRDVERNNDSRWCLAFIRPYRPTAGWVELVISHSAMR